MLKFRFVLLNFYVSKQPLLAQKSDTLHAAQLVIVRVKTTKNKFSHTFSNTFLMYFLHWSLD